MSDSFDDNNPRLQALLNRWSREDLVDLVLFIERAVNHHGRKLTTKETLGIVQHHPMMTAITESYDDGVAPEATRMKAALNNLTPEECEAIAQPHFDHAGRVHDWRNYVPETLIPVWNILSEETRRALYVTCSQRADAEEWD